MSEFSRRAVVVGAGPVGREVARVLIEAGHVVTVVTRSGRPSALPGVRSLAADASDPAALAAVVDGADALLNCANPADYTVWDQVWPPLAASLLTTAERTGATLVTASSLYAYGPVDVAMTEVTPDLATDHKGRLRAQMWADAKAAHDEGLVHAVEVRASDYLGAGVGQNGHVSRHVAAAPKGKAAWMVGNPDLPHTFTDVTDMARTLAVVAFEPSTWGQVWHAVSRGPSSQRQALEGALAAIGVAAVPIRRIPATVLRAGRAGEPDAARAGRARLHLLAALRDGLEPDAVGARSRTVGVVGHPAAHRRRQPLTRPRPWAVGPRFSRAPAPGSSARTPVGHPRTG